MNLRVYYLTGAIALVIGTVFAFIDHRISLGIVLAAVFSLFNMFLLAESMKKVMNSEVPSIGAMMGGNLIRFTLLFAMLYLAYRFPNTFSMVGVAIGVTLFMIALLIDAAGKRKGR